MCVVVYLNIQFPILLNHSNLWVPVCIEPASPVDARQKIEMFHSTFATLANFIIILTSISPTVVQPLGVMVLHSNSTMVCAHVDEIFLQRKEHVNQ